MRCAEALREVPGGQPGLPDFPGHLAVRQMSGFGGMLTIEVTGGGAAPSAVVDRRGLFAVARAADAPAAAWTALTAGPAL